jgi:hypothetical protein
VFVEGLRQEISTGASDGALLQRGMPTEGKAVVAMEKQATMAAVRERPEEAAAAKRSSPRTAAAGWTCISTPESGARGSSQAGLSKDFLAIPATGRVAMSVSNGRGVRRYSDSVPMSAGVR